MKRIVLLLVLAGFCASADAAPTFTATATPNPLTLNLGGPSQSVVVSTAVDPGFTAPEISYAFSGFPAFINNDGPKITTILSGYAPVTFTFSLGGGAVPGTYSGTLTGTPISASPRSFPFTVVIPQPDIAASFTQPVVQICPGQTMNDRIQLAPINGYNGTPTLTFMSAPPGITLNPPSPPAAPMPPGESIPFTISAASGASSGIALLNIRDVAAGINKNIPLTININSSTFTPGIYPSTLALNAGGPAQTETVFVTPSPCFSGTVTVTASGMPAGLTVTPNPVTIAGGSTTMSLQAAPSLPAATYYLTFTYTSGSITKTLNVPVTVSAGPDFALNLTPSALTIPAGTSATTNATITPINGFSGSVSVTAPSIPGVTFTPSTFTLGPGAVVPVTVSVAPGTPSATIPATFSATSASIGGTHSATLMLTIPSAGDFVLDVTPSTVFVPNGGSGKVTVTVRPLNGFTGTVNVQVSPPLAGVTFSPSSFTLAAGASQQVTISVAGVSPETLPFSFSGAANGVGGQHITTISVQIGPAAGFQLALSPAALTIAPGGTAALTASIVPLGSFDNVVTVTAPVIPGVTFTPSTFTLTQSAKQTVTITVDPSAAPRVVNAPFNATSQGFVTSASLALTIAAGPDFTLTADPNALQIPIGSSATTTIRATGLNGFNGPITVVSQSATGLTISPSTFTLLPGASQQVTLTLSDAVTGSPLFPLFTGTAGGVSHSVNVSVRVLPRTPVLTAAGPSSVVTGAQTVIRVSGDFFQPGARFTSSDPSLVIEAAVVRTPQLADLTISVRSDATPGPRALTVTNPDGGVSTTPLIIFVYPTTSIAAPLDVLAAAIVFPARGTLIAPGETVYPRGLLATAGTGTIIGSWQLDGATFDRFTVNAAGGMPVEIRANVPIPSSYMGTHLVTIEIEKPRKVVAPAIEVVDSADRVSRLTLLAPRDGQVVRDAPLFRWSLVPNCAGYDVEVAPPDLELITRFHVADAEWRPTAAQLAAIGAGIRRWRVRPRCAGDVELEPSPWQRFAVAPQRVAITLLPPRGRSVRWNAGGAVGVVYRVELLSPAGDVVFAALSAGTEYTLPRLAPAAASIRIRAIGWDGASVGTSNVAALAIRNGVQLAQQTVIELGAVEPADGATVATAQPHLAAEWKGAAKAEDVTLMLDGTDVTNVAKVTPASIAYDALTPLAPGPHTAALSVAGNVKRWTFTVGDAAAATAAAPAAPPPRGDWVIAPLGSITVVRGANNEAHTQISALTDLNTAGVANKLTGDVGVKHDFGNDSTVQESRNWVGDIGKQQAENRKEAVRFGFTQPDFFDQAQFLNAGLARGGIEAKAVLPGAVLSYYETFASHLNGLATGLFGMDQKLRAGAITFPVGDKLDLRIFGMRVTDEPGFNSPGGKGRAFGIFSRYTPFPALTTFVEAARGDFDQNTFSSNDARQRGNAWRVGLLGIRGTANYTFNLRRTDAGFVNPANRGFTAGGVPDRTAADLTVGKIFGMTSVNVQLRHMQDGTTENLLVPRTRETGAVLTLNRVVNQIVSVALSGNVTSDKGEEKAEALLPRADRVQRGATGTVSEVYGRFNFGETLSQQVLRDHQSSLNDSTTTTAALTSGGQVTDFFNVNSLLSATRTEGSSIVGTTNQHLASLQPAFLVPKLFVTFQPRVSYSTTTNDLVDSRSTLEQYQGLLTFAPQWFNSFVAFQLSADWTRNKTDGQPLPAKFVHRYTGSLNLHWRAGAGPAYTAGAPAPAAPAK